MTDQPKSHDLGRGMTNPIYIPAINPEIEIMQPLNETDGTLPENVTQEMLDETSVARGFRASIFGADIMQRHGFSLAETKGGRIFADSTNGSKLRRKIIRGQPQQNFMFEAYQTIDNNARPLAEVEISSNGFTPAMLIAAVAAKVSKEGHPKYNSQAVMLLQAASALLLEGEQAARGEAKLADGDPKRKEYYRALSGVTVRANTLSIIRDLLNNVIRDDEEFNSGFSEDMDALRRFRAVELEPSEDDLAEINSTINLLFAASTSLAFSPGFLNIQEIADEVKANVGDAALAEVSDAEQK